MSQIVLDEDLYPKVHTLRIIPSREIMPSPYQHRKSFDPVRLEELAQSIIQDGLISPILVRPVDKHFEIIADSGANLPPIPVETCH